MSESFKAPPTQAEIREQSIRERMDEFNNMSDIDKKRHLHGAFNTTENDGFDNTTENDGFDNTSWVKNNE